MNLPTHKHYLGRDFYKDWLAIVIFTCVLVLIFIVFAVNRFNDINTNIDGAVSSSGSDSLPFEHKALDVVVGQIDGRVANQKMILNSNTAVPDPSI